MQGISQQFSVLMSLYAGESPAYLQESLDSIMAQTLPAKDIVIVKDGPLTKELDAVLDDFADQYPNQLTLLPLLENVGLGEALQQGIKACRSPIIIRLDTNTVAAPNRFALQLEAMENNQELVIVGGQIQELEGSPVAHFAKTGAPLTDEEIRETLPKRNPFFHETVCYRRGAVLEAGNYHSLEWFEDYWLWFRLLEQGKAMNLPETLVYIRDSEDKFLRRGGNTYARSIRTFQQFLLQEKYISRPKYLWRSLTGTIGAHLPGGIRVRLYNRSLTKEKKKHLQAQQKQEQEQAATEKLTKEQEEYAMAQAMVQQCDAFLKEQGMHHEEIALKEEALIYQKEMQKGLEGTDSTLMMLPTYISVSHTVPYDQPIIVIDAGGTNFRTAVVTFREGEEPLIEDFTLAHMPGTKGTVTSDEFFDTIAQRLLPIIDRSQRVGFCFSYPTTILPNKDGRFISFSKEISVTGMEGKVLGEETNKALAKYDIEPKEFLVLNDTVAAMLGGVVGANCPNADGYLGFILGTGTNTCYPEKTEKITKDKAAQAQGGEMAINVESGGYGGFVQGELDKAFDNSTQKPGFYKFEKMVSGAYQGGVIFLTVLKAGEQGLLSQQFMEGLSLEAREIPLWEVDQFLENPTGDNPLAQLCQGESDRAVLEHIFTVSYHRAAKLSAICLAGTILQMGKGTDPDRPVCVTAEGTTFEKSRVYREKLDQLVESFMNKELGIYCQFHKVEDATLLGTAMAGLTG